MTRAMAIGDGASTQCGSDMHRLTGAKGVDEEGEVVLSVGNSVAHLTLCDTM